MMREMMVDRRSGRSMNVAERYVRYMMDNFGQVSFGKFFRCQTSHRGGLTKRQLYLSFMNLDSILHWAETTDETKRVVKKMSSSVKRGGVHNIGPFYSQVIINIATKIGLLKNHVHAETVFVSHSTATYKRLKRLGVKTANHAAEVVPYLSRKLGVTSQNAENMLCEYLRRKFGNNNTKDLFIYGHLLFKLLGGKIYTIDARGAWKRAAGYPFVRGVGYDAIIKWWLDENRIGDKWHEWDYENIDLKNKRVRSK